MKKTVQFLASLMLGMIFLLPGVEQAQAYNFGDFRSETLTTKAWEALQKEDIEAVLAYTNKNIELYSDQAKKMQTSMKDYAKGTNDEIFAYWALNDIATSYFIQGEAYRQKKMMDEAKEAYSTVVNEYSFGQTWDPKGWFWKPADASKEKLAMIESGINLDFGDYTSSYMTTKAWEALAANDLNSVLAYTDKVIELYADKAKKMQESMTEYAWGPNEDENKKKIFSYWALNDVGTCYFIRGEALKNAGQTDEAKKAYKTLIDEYYYAQCWDPKGWFWKPAEAATQALEEVKQS